MIQRYAFRLVRKTIRTLLLLNGNYSSYDLALSADRNTTIYGNSDTVQPKALRGYALIRYE